MAGVITRALETMDKTFLRCSAAVKVGSVFIFMKGPNVDKELVDFEKRFGDNVKRVLDEAYVLPDSSLDRRLLVFEVVQTLEGSDEADSDGDSELH